MSAGLHRGEATSGIDRELTGGRDKRNPRLEEGALGIASSCVRPFFGGKAARVGLVRPSMETRVLAR